MKKQLLGIVMVSALVLLSSCSNQKPAQTQPQQNWTHFVRIAGHGLNLNNVDNIIKSATETHVFGIETDNDIPGRYESFLDPTEKLQAIKAIAEKAHQIGNYSFVYIAGLECITANADKTEHTFFKDHPDWMQRKLNGEPAIFGGGTAFWIDEGDEDVWISPYAQEWRKIYMERVRQIAATGIEESAVRVGADVYDMYPVVDVIAHEYDGSGEHAASKDPLHWFSYLSGMYSFRAFAGEKASWMLTYSWDGEEKINPAEAMKNLALANVMAGTNC